MLCRLFFQIYIKIKTEITEIDIAERQQEQIIKIKTEITEIDIAESKIQLISLQLNPREKEGTNRTQEREKEPTELKRERRNLLNSREGEPSEAPSSNVLQQISLHIREFRQNPVRHTLIVFLLFPLQSLDPQCMATQLTCRKDILAEGISHHQHLRSR